MLYMCMYKFYCLKLGLRILGCFINYSIRQHCRRPGFKGFRVYGFSVVEFELIIPSGLA